MNKNDFSKKFQNFNRVNNNYLVHWILLKVLKYNYRNKIRKV